MKGLDRKFAQKENPVHVFRYLINFLYIHMYISTFFPSLILLPVVILPFTAIGVFDSAFDAFKTVTNKKCKQEEPGKLYVVLHRHCLELLPSITWVSQQHQMCINVAINCLNFDEAELTEMLIFLYSDFFLHFLLQYWVETVPLNPSTCPLESRIHLNTDQWEIMTFTWTTSLVFLLQSVKAPFVFSLQLSNRVMPFSLNYPPEGTKLCCMMTGVTCYVGNRLIRSHWWLHLNAALSQDSEIVGYPCDLSPWWHPSVTGLTFVGGVICWWHLLSCPISTEHVHLGVIE